jgi:CHAT domain-containing protein
MRLGKDAPRERAEAAAREVEALTTEWEAAKARITAANPRYVDLKQSAPLTATQIQGDVLDDDTVLLEYALGRKRSFLWAVTRTSLRTYELPARTAVEDAARAAYARLAQAAPTGETKAGDADPLAALGRMLLAPAAAALDGKRVLVVPDGALHYVSFAALPDPRGGGPLIASHEVVAAPSASVLAQLRRAETQRRPAPRTVAVLADPVFDRDDARLRAKAQSRANAPPAAANRDLLRAMEDSGLAAGLPRLVFTRREAQAILKMVTPTQGRASLDFDASRATVNDASLADFRIVHFATHGFFNASHPDLSGLVLSLLDREGHDARGFFSTADIFNLRLRADLVVLSGCRTALGRDIYGEGIVGLSRGFMYAGAPRLVASLWTVDDAATAELMTEFYRGVLVRGLRPAAALQAAQRELMRRTRFRDPFYWAAFQLQGEWR